MSQSRVQNREAGQYLPNLQSEHECQTTGIKRIHHQAKGLSQTNSYGGCRGWGQGD